MVADSGAGAARVGDGPGAGGASGIRGTRAEGERERPGFRKGVNELSGKKFENTRDLLGDLLGAKKCGCYSAATDKFLCRNSEERSDGERGRRAGWCKTTIPGGEIQ
jgi:hypothetical protein